VESDPTSSGEPSEGGDDDGTDEPSAYGVVLQTLDPEPGSTTHFYRDPLRFTYSGDARGVGVELRDADGQSVPVTLWWSADGSSCRVVPDAGALRPLTEYEVVISLNASNQAWTFTTSSLGSPMTSPTAVDGRTYALTLDGARSFEPPGAVDLLASALGGRAILWTFAAQADDDGDGAALDVDPSTGSYSGSLWSEEACRQDPALLETLGGMALQNPYFVRPAGELRVTTSFGVVRFVDTVLDGDFTPSGDAIADAGLRGHLVASSADPFFGDAGAACASFAALGSPCVPCPAGAVGEDCLRVEVDHISGALVDASLTDYEDANCPDGPQPLVACSATGPAPAASFASLLGLVLLAGRRTTRARRAFRPHD
jgi:hypothetical protein